MRRQLLSPPSRPCLRHMRQRCNSHSAEIREDQARKENDPEKERRAVFSHASVYEKALKAIQRRCPDKEEAFDMLRWPARVSCGPLHP